MNFRSAPGHHVCREALPGKRRWSNRQRLGAGEYFAFDRRRRHGAIFDREQRLACFALEHIHVPGLGDLRHGVNQFALALYGDQARWSRQVPIPHVVLDGLEMPDSFARAGVQSQQRIGEQVVAHAIGAVEVIGGRPGGHEDHTSLFVQRHTGPIVGRSGILPRFLGPRIVAELARMRNGVKRPANLAGADVEGADVTGCRRQVFARHETHDQHVFVSYAGCGRAHGDLAEIAAQPRAQIDAPAFSEALDESAGARVDGEKEMARRYKNAALGPIPPHHHAPVARPARQARRGRGLKAPLLAARGGIERKQPQGRTGAIQHSVHHHRVALDLRALGCVAGVVLPGDGEFIGVSAIDLREAGVSDTVVAAAVDGPAGVTGFWHLSRLAPQVGGQQE